MSIVGNSCGIFWSTSSNLDALPFLGAEQQLSEMALARLTDQLLVNVKPAPDLIGKRCENADTGLTPRFL